MPEQEQQTQSAESLLNGLFSGGSTQEPVETIEEAPKEEGTQDLAPKQETADTKEVKEEPKAEEKPEPEAKDAKEETSEDPMDAYLRGGEPKQEELPDEVKAILKDRFGIEDPEAYQKTQLVQQEETTQLKAKAERLEAIEQSLNKLPLELEEVISDYLQGKEKDPIGRIKEMGVSVSVPSKDVEPTSLVDHYFKGKFTAEQIEEIKDGDADDALKDVFNKYHELAAAKHDDRGTQHKTRLEQSQNEVKQRYAAREQSALEAVAELKRDKALSSMVDPSVIEDFKEGRLEAKYLYNADGSYKPDALKRLVIPEIHQKMLERVRQGAFSNGETQGRLRERADQPTGPTQANGARTAPSKQGNEGSIENLLNQLQAGKTPAVTT